MSTKTNCGKAKPSLNDATRAQLLKAYNIGPILSRRILESRPFTNWKHVEETVVQIGPERIKSLKSKFELDEPGPEAEVKTKRDEPEAEVKTKLEAQVEDQQSQEVHN